MGSNINNDLFYFDYSVEFDNDFIDPYDTQALDNFIATLTLDICPDPVELRGIIVDVCHKLSKFILRQNGVHNIARIITYNNYNYKISLHNSDTTTPTEQISNILANYMIGNKYEFDL